MFTFYFKKSVFINGDLDIRYLHLMVGFLDVGCISDSLVLNSTKLHISLGFTLQIWSKTTNLELPKNPERYGDINSEKFKKRRKIVELV